MKMQKVKSRSGNDALINIITSEFSKTKDLGASFEALLNIHDAKMARTREEAEFLQAVQSILDLQAKVKAE